ncbi:hypothetical protein GCM10007418_08090 [Halopseudomonas salina]|uniref:Uncharacterized protein n=1 Tax=Halopseudomonas salina TaxID=1323744 RepID=A0ABQ1P4E6_9GAMM|nr:hypothetical protein GCM10007418_08090 [Halopseudomonas salina]
MFFTAGPKLEAFVGLSEVKCLPLTIDAFFAEFVSVHRMAWESGGGVAVGACLDQI